MLSTQTRRHHMNPVHRRLVPLYQAFLLGGVALWVPVEKLFLTQIGFTAQTIGLVAASYAVVVPILEIPTGILADRWSRRGVLVIGNIGAFLSVLVGGLSTNVAMYLVSAVLLGVFFAMHSGTFDAIVYDTVVEETGSSDQFEATIGRVKMIESASLVVGGLAGGALAAATNPRIAYFATLPFLAVATLCLLRFREPTLHQASERRSVRRHVAVMFGTLRVNRRLIPIAAALVLTALLTQAVVEFGPLWLIDAKAGPGAFGPAWAALMAALGLGGYLAGRLHLDTAKAGAGVAGLLLCASGLLLIAHNVVIVTLAQACMLSTAVAITVYLTGRLHDGVASDVRSGVSSGIGLMTWLVFLPFALAFGMVTARLGVHVAGWFLVVTAVVTSVLFIAVTATAKRPTAGVVSAVLGVVPQLVLAEPELSAL
jgi:MFS family permease